MQSEFVHLSESEMVLAANGELSTRRKPEVDAHLETCWFCRERMLSLQNTIADLVRARNREFDQMLPDGAGPRALLRARLSEIASEKSPSLFSRFHFPAAPLTRLVAAGAAFLAVVFAILVTFESNVNAGGPKPRLRITPGETRSITLDEVCLYSKAEVISRDIPEDKKRQVYAMYGIRSPKANEFEVDYLITPDLGGTESIRNLWPQPYSARWNAHVKDELEERLHELVCSHKLDLATAQHDIAVDWIAAYKKYVGEDAKQ